MTKSFLVGIQELEDQIGPEATEEWMRKIGEKLGEMEGQGIMGDQEGPLNCFRICLFAPKLSEFLEEFGSPEEHEKILKYVKREDRGEGGPAVVNVCCPMCYAYRKKRGELAGKKDLLHLGAKYKHTGKVNISEEACKKAGYTKKQVEKLLEEYDCVNKYVE